MLVIFLFRIAQKTRDLCNVDRWMEAKKYISTVGVSFSLLHTIGPCTLCTNDNSVLTMLLHATGLHPINENRFFTIHFFIHPKMYRKTNV